jgi:hypothetical protein
MEEYFGENRMKVLGDIICYILIACAFIWAVVVALGIVTPF